MKKIAGAIMLMSLTGCATVSFNETSRTDLRVGRTPELGIETTASVGSQIFSQYRYLSRTGYRLGRATSTRIGLGRVITSDGEFVGRAQIDGENAYCTESLAYHDPMTGPMKIACFFDRDTDGKFEVVKAQPGVVWFESKLDVPVTFAKGEQVIPMNDSKKYELLYQGYSGNTLRLSYREYINDMARPAYFQDVSYEIAAFPTDITFKTVKLQVLSAGNNGMRYKVLSEF